MTDRETGEVAAIAFPATAVATVATCAAATVTTFAAAACAAFVAKVSIGARSGSVIGPLSARSTRELPRRNGTAAFAARCACARQASDG